jgi:hypothetical protein
MTTIASDATISRRTSASLPVSEIDFVLSVQFTIGWAGEGGEEPRLGWWRTDLASEFGGVDLFRTLLPSTWEWAVLESVREAARRHDAACRSKDHNADRIISLFNLGFELDERIEERLHELKGSNRTPKECLPLLSTTDQNWDRSRFEQWIATHGDVTFTAAPVGRRLKGDPPTSPKLLVTALVAALTPLGHEYPLPHFRRDV